MRVCTAREMAVIDRQTIAGGVEGKILMERAGCAMAEACWEFIEEQEDALDPAFSELDATSDPASILVVCGKGNNGGDGLVLARLMNEEGADVTVMMLAGRSELTLDTGYNFDRLPPGVSIVHASAQQWACTFEQLSERAHVVVDAIFGTGITPPLRAYHVDLIRAINDSGLPCLALDIPSGVCGDDGRVDPVAVAADTTVTVGLPKRGLLMGLGREFCGQLIVVDIGFPKDICQANTQDHHHLTRWDYLNLLPSRPPGIHKYSAGTVAILAGSRSFGGAAHLAGLGALRSGAGLVKMGVPKCLEVPIRVGLPEALVVPLAETDRGTVAPLDPAALQDFLKGQRAWAVGPGLDDHPETDHWLIYVLKTTHLPVVVDADGLGAFARQGSTPHFGAREVVLTPHAGELARLAGMKSTEVEDQKLELVPKLAKAWGVTLLLKGPTTLIATPEGKLFFSTKGNDALAHGGSGDVLTGLISGLLAQGLSATEAALLGAYVHGRAGQEASQWQSSRSVLVREVADAVGTVFDEMEKEASASSLLREKLWLAECGDTE